MDEETTKNIQIVEEKRVTEQKWAGSNSVILRDDFDSGPVSLDLIEEGLYLGNLKAACDTTTLQNFKITHILTLDSVPLPRTITEMTSIINKFVQVTDIPKEDLISHFADTNEFIKQGQEKGAVLVHCYFGMSRSAAVVIAYMMAKHSLTFEEAFYLVKAKRTITYPNSGFIAQLKLYGKMDCILDKEHPKYKQFRLKLAAEHVRKVKILPQSSADLIKPDPGLTREKPDPHVYRCKKCRRIVASHQNIIPHIPKSVKMALSRRPTYKNNAESSQQQQQPQETEKKCDISCVQNSQILIEKLKSLACRSEVKEDQTSVTVMKVVAEEGMSGNQQIITIESDGMGTQNIADDLESAEICTETYFIEPLAWMKDVHKNVQGKLHCPKCSSKLGSFSWIMGCQCPCGIKVAPAFYLVPSKVEWSNMVQNVQVTV